ncbi:elongation factor 1-beta [Candidatus Woesearchaeota archaeon]|nr:elongation factor 1-beta [Candidatus Woesearchaeota archaeon]
MTLKVQTNMADVVVTFRIMPQNPGINLSHIEVEAKKEIVKFCNSKEFKTQIEPIAFGLKALNILFVMDENKGSTEELENKISQIKGVESVEVTDVRRAIG